MGIATLWTVDAYGCDPAALRSVDTLEALLAAAVRVLDLHPVAPPCWHRFPGPGGVTGYVLLSESHLAVHTYPEHGYASIDLHCCRPDAAFDWERAAGDALGAARVVVRRLPRGDLAGADVVAPANAGAGG
jgi:S-adenosylmethionine decarboxylase